MIGTERDTLSLLYRRITQVTQTVLAERINLSTSQMSRIVSGETGIPIDRLPLLLNALELRLIERHGTMVTTTQEEYAALICMAERGRQERECRPAGNRYPANVFVRAKKNVRSKTEGLHGYKKLS